MTLLSTIISRLFPKSRIGMLFMILFSKATTVVAAEIIDPTNQKIAYQFVKTLSQRDDLTNCQKQKMFNQQMLKWAKAVGKKMSESVISCLRELAVNALKAECVKSK